MNNSSVTPHRASRDHVWRHLTVATESEDTHETRVFGPSGAAKLKDLVDSGTQNLKKLAQKAKVLIISKNLEVADKRFNKLNVGRVKSNFLESEQCQSWIKSVAKLYKNNPEAGDVTVVSTLVSHYGDNAVASMLVVAGRDASTMNTAERLKRALLTEWISKEKSADDVFILLKLGDEGEKMFDSPLWGTWAAYATKLENSNQLMFLVLRKHYDDDHLANTLAAAAHDRRTSEFAGNLEEILRVSWFSTGKTADDIFNILKLDQQGDDFFINPALRTWISYVKMLHKDPYEMLVLMLAKRYDDEALINMLRIGRRDHRTMSIGVPYVEAQLNIWHKDGKSADEVFNLLKLDEKDTQFLKGRC